MAIVTGKSIVIPNLLTEEECQRQIDASERNGYLDAPVTTAAGPKMLPEIRNNTRYMVDFPDLSAALWLRIQPYAMEVPGWEAIGLNERLRYYRYDRGQYFAPHCDGAFVRNSNERSMVTVLIYLNEDFEGGETIVEGIPVVPRTGQALLFFHPVLHEGATILRGRKYVLRTDILYRRTQRHSG
jgi:predicted 2-oxoglutarate/Fe(II)-dependent dioxygenase YbiX